MSDDGVVRQVQGVCEGVMERNGWCEFHINVGRQYPVKLSTKKDEIITIARLAGAQQAVWTFSEHQGGPNPHKPGEFFKNRYLSNVVVGGALDPALAGNQPGQTSMTIAPPGASGGAGHPSSEGREASIERQTIVKAAISVFPNGAITTEDQWFALLVRLDTWMAAPRGAAPAPGGTLQADNPPPHGDGDVSPFPADDDIPF